MNDECGHHQMWLYRLQYSFLALCCYSSFQFLIRGLYLLLLFIILECKQWWIKPIICFLFFSPNYSAILISQIHYSLFPSVFFSSYLSIDIFHFRCVRMIYISFFPFICLPKSSIIDWWTEYNYLSSISFLFWNKNKIKNNF